MNEKDANNNDFIPVEYTMVGSSTLCNAIIISSETSQKYMQINSGNAEPVVTIRFDGRVEVNPKYSADDAAKLFWAAVQKLGNQVGDL